MTPYATSDGRSAHSEADQGSTADPSAVPTVVLLLFAAARVAAGTSGDRFEAHTVEDLLGQARVCYGPDFAAVLEASKVWVNGEPSGAERALRPGDEVAVLPPVSGGG